MCVCVLGFRFRLRPAFAGSGSWCVCPGLGLGFTPPFLAGSLGSVRWCALSVCIPPFLAGVCGLLVGFCLASSPVPWFLPCCVRFPGLRPLVLGTRPCALVMAGGVPLWRASGSRVVLRAPLRPIALSAPVRCFVAEVPSPTGGFGPWIYSAAARGTWIPAEYRAPGTCC